jgi:hypothetical protein
MSALPDPVVRALGEVLQDLEARGFMPRLDSYSPESLGNFSVTFCKGQESLLLTSDRGQLRVGGGITKLSELGLWRAFDSPSDLREPLRAWIEASRI